MHFAGIPSESTGRNVATVSRATCAPTFRLRWTKFVLHQRIRSWHSGAPPLRDAHLRLAHERWTRPLMPSRRRNTNDVEIAKPEPVKMPRQWTICAAPKPALCGLALCSSRTLAKETGSALKNRAPAGATGAEFVESLLHRYRERGHAANCYRARSCPFDGGAEVIAEGREA